MSTSDQSILDKFFKSYHKKDLRSIFDTSSGMLDYIILKHLKLSDIEKSIVCIDDIIESLDETINLILINKLDRCKITINNLYKFISNPEGDINSSISTVAGVVGSLLVSSNSTTYNIPTIVYIILASLTVVLQLAFIMFQTIIKQRWKCSNDFNLEWIGNIITWLFLFSRLMLAIALVIVSVSIGQESIVESLIGIIPSTFLSISWIKFCDGVLNLYKTQSSLNIDT